MKRRLSQPAVAFFLALALALPAPAVTARAAGPVGTSVELRLPPEGAIGEELVTEAHLTDETGSAVTGVEVLFQRQVEFMRAGGELELGRGVTDQQGLARVSFVPRSEGHPCPRAALVLPLDEHRNPSSACRVSMERMCPGNVDTR